ncbi:YciI family protein [Spirillospora sp. NPDC029432]|uniref:YciI family protein n=1 Tax=Spirillospora sp. NPDC029432 TaxID=3154599 RepID=UPI00345246FF
MKYMLLMQFGAEPVDFPPLDTWTPDEIKAHIAFMGESNRKLTESGELVSAEGLDGPEAAKIVRADAAGRPVVTDGPYSETKEFLIGYWIVDCEGPERALEIAAYLSTAPGPGGKPLNMPIQVRQIMAGPPEEM